MTKYAILFIDEFSMYFIVPVALTLHFARSSDNKTDLTHRQSCKAGENMVNILMTAN